MKKVEIYRRLELRALSLLQGSCSSPLNGRSFGAADRTRIRLPLRNLTPTARAGTAISARFLLLRPHKAASELQTRPFQRPKTSTWKSYAIDPMGIHYPKTYYLLSGAREHGKVPFPSRNVETQGRLARPTIIRAQKVTITPGPRLSAYLHLIV